MNGKDVTKCLMEITNRLQYWLAWGLIRSGVMQKVAVSASEINQIVKENLPAAYPLPLNRGKGELVISQANVDFPTYKPGYFRAQLRAALHIHLASVEIYRSHLNIELSGCPRYQASDHSLRIDNLSVDAVKLIQDSYSLMASANGLLRLALPTPFTHIMNVAVETSIGVMSDVLGEDLQSYLALYRTGSMQRVLDYHAPQIEATLQEECQHGELHYQLSEQLLDEKLFIQLGKTMEINEQIFFCRF